MDTAPVNQKLYYQLKPGSPTVCGHGNREFSFFAHKGQDTSKVIVVFASGGMCWDAESCGDPMFRSMAIDALQVEPARAFSTHVGSPTLDFRAEARSVM
eukprot:1280388-Rhodomonas_salina.1